MSTPQMRRGKWMNVLALADGARLQRAWEDLGEPPAFKVVRGPETGLVMVRARAGNSGRRFNLGEMTVTRCSVSLENGLMGHAWIAGIAPDHARLAALFDAMLQDPGRHGNLEQNLIEPLRSERTRLLAQRAGEVLPTKVDFFTLVRGED